MTISTPQNSVHSSGGVPSPSAGASFDIVRRGYDRDQVDAQIRELRDRLAASEASRKAAETHARAVEGELRTSRAQTAEGPISQESFGFRAEKILRLAEHEAADVRSRAANEATALVEQARADAERHRHEVEQKLIARSAELDQEAAQRNVAIQEREQQAAATLAAAREDATRITDDARASADKVISEAQTRAEEVRQRCDQDVKRRRDAGEQELRRVGALHDSVRAEMSRLHKLLGHELTENNNARKKIETSASDHEGSSSR